MKPKRGIDWEAVRKRLKESSGGLEGGQVLEPRRIEEAYRRRAAELGRANAPAASARAAEILTFTLGPERYGLELSAVGEVIPFAGCAPLPGAPPEILGVVNRRGEILLVADLARRLGLPHQSSAAEGIVIIMRQAEGRAGFRVDRVEAIRRSAPEELVKPDRAGGGKGPVRGLTPDGVILLEARELLRASCLKEVSKP